MLAPLSHPEGKTLIILKSDVRLQKIFYTLWFKGLQEKIDEGETKKSITILLCTRVTSLHLTKCE